MIGKVIANRYRVESQIGIGGMGIVYRAQDTRLGRDVALKVIAPHLVQDQEARDRFLREAQALAGLSHPNIVTVHDLLEDPETNDVFIVMELLNGAPLRKHITDPTRPSFPDMSIQLCRALECAHASGILHRDIKPENVFVTSDGTIKLMDFGLARLVDSASVSQSGAVTGTIAYMAPEQLRGGNLDARTDLYSLGILFYEYLCGFTPFAADNPGTILLKHLTEQPPSLRARVPSVSIELESLIMRLLAKDPTARYPSALVLRDQIERMRAGVPMQVSAMIPTNSTSVVANSSKIPLTVPKATRGRGKGVTLPAHLRNAPRQTWRLMVVACLVLMCVIAAFSFGETIQRLITSKMDQTPPKKEASGKVKKGSGSKSNQSNRKQRRAQNSDSGSFSDPYADMSSRSQRVAPPRTRAVRKVAHKEPTLAHDPNKAGDNGKESDPPDGKVEGNDPPPDSADNTETTSDPNK